MFKRKEDAWKEVLGAREEDARESVWKSTMRKRKRLKGAFINVRKRSKAVWKEDESRSEWK